MQEPRGEGATQQGLGFAERMVNDMAESAKLYWRWWGPLGEPMVRATDEWADAQRRYLESLRGTQKEAGGDEPRGGSRAEPNVPSWPWVPPLRGLSYAAWPGPGGSEGGGWDR
ncbi:MAG: hypothetical protein M3315_12580 [Actinomycetota bacterium]|nr:hypothetical protein [Actinomycetota bacterium]